MIRCVKDMTGFSDMEKVDWGSDFLESWEAAAQTAAHDCREALAGAAVCTRRG